MENIIQVFVVSYIFSVLASISGIGGGGMLVPLYSLVGNISIKESIVLSIVTIAGNSLVRAVYYSFKKHSLANNRYLPNYDVVRLISLFAGNTAYIGYLLNQLLPEIAIFIMIVIIISAIIIKLGFKIYNMIKPIDDEYVDSSSNVINIFDLLEDPSEDINLTNITSDTTDEYPDGEDMYNVINNYIYTMAGFCIIVLCTFAREYNDLFYIAQTFLVILFGYLTIQHIKLLYQHRLLNQFNFVNGDIVWSDNINFIKYCASASLVGITSTMLGIGGGMIINPIMMNLGMTADVVVATSSVTVFFSMVISAAQFIVDGMFEWYYPILFSLGGLASLTSIVILNFMKNIKLVITCILMVSLVTSLVLMLIVNIKKLVD